MCASMFNDCICILTDENSCFFHISAFLLLCCIFCCFCFSSSLFCLGIEWNKVCEYWTASEKVMYLQLWIQKRFYDAWLDERWRFISAKKNRQKREKSKRVWREKERKTLQQLLIAHRYFSLLCFAIIVVTFIENKDTGH